MALSRPSSAAIALAIAALAICTFKLIARASQLQCAAPKGPFCIENLGYSRDEDMFNACRNEMNHYRGKVREYLDCMDSEKSDATGRYNKAVERFNCYVEGRPVCY